MYARLPGKKDVLPVYAVVAFIIQGWTIVKLLWQIPSWGDFLSLGTISGIFAYRIAASFFESLVVMAFLLLLSLIFPKIYFKDAFVTRGTAFALTLLGLIMLFWNRFYSITPGLEMVKIAWGWLIGAICLSWLISHISVKIRVLQRVLLGLADRMVVFLYFLIPISLVSLALILVRNVG